MHNAGSLHCSNMEVFSSNVLCQGKQWLLLPSKMLTTWVRPTLVQMYALQPVKRFCAQRTGTCTVYTTVHTIMVACIKRYVTTKKQSGTKVWLVGLQDGEKQNLWWHQLLKSASFLQSYSSKDTKWALYASTSHFNNVYTASHNCGWINASMHALLSLWQGKDNFFPFRHLGSTV